MKFSSAAIVTLASNILQRCVFLAIAFLATNYLGTAEFGRFVLGYAFAVNIGQVLSDPLAIGAGVNSDANCEAAFLRVSVLGGIITSISSALLSPALSSFAGGGLTSIYLCSSLLLLFQIPATVATAILYALEKPIAAAMTTSIASIWIVAGCFIAVRLGVGSETLLIIIFVGAALQILLSAFFIPRVVWDEIISSRLVIRLPWKATILPTAGVIALSTPVHFACLSILASSSDGLHQTALFSTLYVLSSLFTFVPAGLRSLVLPTLSNTSLRAQSRQLLLILTFGSAAILATIIIGGSHQILAVFGDSFKGEDRLILIICLIGVALAAAHAVNYLMWSRKQGIANFFVMIGYAFVYVATTYYFVHLRGDGAEGLAKALALALTFQLLANLIIQSRGRYA